MAWSEGGAHASGGRHRLQSKRNRRRERLRRKLLFLTPMPVRFKLPTAVRRTSNGCPMAFQQDRGLEHWDEPKPTGNNVSYSCSEWRCCVARIDVVGNVWAESGPSRSEDIGVAARRRCEMVRMRRLLGGCRLVTSSVREERNDRQREAWKQTTKQRPGQAATGVERYRRSGGGA